MGSFRCGNRQCLVWFTWLVSLGDTITVFAATTITLSIYPTRHDANNTSDLALVSETRGSLSVQPLVTLAITTLNRPRYLAETLKSALAQDYTNLDILISDNGSTDETISRTRALVKSDPRVRLRHNDTTVPIYEHFTQCVQAARGEYFILLHDDDRINPCFVSELAGVAMRHPDVNIVVPANVQMDENGATIREFAKPVYEVLDGPTFVCHWLFSKDPQFLVDVTTNLMRTEIIRRFRGYQSFGGGRNIDNLLFLQCAITSHIGFSQKAVFYWRSYPESYGSRATPQQVAASGQAFIQHLHRNPETICALATLPPLCRTRILRGVERMTTYEFTHHIKLNEYAFHWRTIKVLLMSGRRDITFLGIVFREYIRHASPASYYWVRDMIWRPSRSLWNRVRKEIVLGVILNMWKN